ncbi:unnamed protein product [Meganyctiphanes norvegica]|uniref:Uncharacterized protein n=1 Tax=Meganyctiphanes norvegica TaxID=48144 RepID=A0AAV2SBW1_MEGNR
MKFTNPILIVHDNQGCSGGGDLGQLGNSHAGEVARDVNGSNTGAAENDNETETNSEEIYEAETDVPEYVDVRNLTKMIGLNNSDIESVKDQVIKMYKAMGVLFSLLTPGCLKEAKQKNEVEVRKNNVLRRHIADAEDGILAKNLSKVVNENGKTKNENAWKTVNHSGKRPSERSEMGLALAETDTAAATAATAAAPVVVADQRNEYLDRQRDLNDAKRRKNIIIVGVKETRSGVSQYRADKDTLGDILKKLGYERKLRFVVDICRLGNRTQSGRRNNRLIKVDFNSETTVNDILARTPRLAEDPIFSRIYLKKDLTLAERKKLAERRRRSAYTESDYNVTDSDGDRWGRNSSSSGSNNSRRRNNYNNNRNSTINHSNDRNYNNNDSNIPTTNIHNNGSNSRDSSRNYNNNSNNNKGRNINIVGYSSDTSDSDDERPPRTRQMGQNSGTTSISSSSQSLDRRVGSFLTSCRSSEGNNASNTSGNVSSSGNEIHRARETAV